MTEERRFAELYVALRLALAPGDPASVDLAVVATMNDALPVETRRLAGAWLAAHDAGDPAALGAVCAQLQARATQLNIDILEPTLRDLQDR